ncbi:MAG TPA: class I SAM-dependent methyltransferase [Thermoanaerobaculia bacterium]
MPAELPYRDFLYPLNVFMHVLTREEGGVSYLHYGLFERPDESIAAAQERSTKLLIDRLPPPPARILEVGIGLGTTLDRLTRLGYDAAGITPDAKQVAMARQRFGDAVRVENVAFEQFVPRPFDTIVFQESSQYIDASSLFAKAKEIGDDIIVVDEFSTGEGALHRLDEFLQSAAANGYRLTEEVDLSTKAAPTIDYFMQRLERYRPALITDLALTNAQVDELIASGALYRQRYLDGTYVYRLLRFRK